MLRRVPQRSFLWQLSGTLTFAVLLAASVAGAAIAQDQRTAAAAPGPAKTVRLLTVGNSFSGDATRLLDELAAAAGNELIHHSAGISGGSMAQHWEKAQQHERDPQDPRGFYGSKRSLRQELLAQPWDFVTIQQASILSHDPATYRPFARQLHGYIKKLAPQAEVLVHQTWAYRSDDSRFARPSDKPGEPATAQAMYEGLTRAYETIAAELGARIIPVGDAFFLADSDPSWGFKPDTTFDPKRATNPMLPDQTRSLHVGWQWKQQAGGMPTLGRDARHAGVAGQYLAACVFYGVLFGESIESNTFVPKGIDAAYARFLRQTAHKVVTARQSRKTLLPAPAVAP